MKDECEHVPFMSPALRTIEDPDKRTSLKVPRRGGGEKERESLSWNSYKHKGHLVMHYDF